MRSTLRAVTGQASAFALSLCATTVIAARLGPADQGRFAIVRTGVILAEALLWLGLNSGFSYWVARDSGRNLRALYFVSLLHFGVFMSLLVLGFFLLREVEIGLERFEWIVDISRAVKLSGLELIAWLATWCIFQLHHRTLTSLKEFDRANIITMLSGAVVLFLFLGVGIRTWEWVVWLHVLGLLCAVFLSAVWILPRLRDGGGESWSVAARRAYRTGRTGFASTLAFLVLYRVDLVFVKSWSGALETGIYAVASFVVEAAQKVSDWFAAIIAPQVASGLDKPERLAWRYAIWGASIVLALGTVVAVCCAIGFYPLLFILGDGYKGVEEIVLALIPRGILHAFMVLFAGILSGRGYTRFHPAAGFAAVFTLVMADSMLVPRFGSHGAAVGITLAYSIACAGMMWGVRRTAVAV